MESIEGENSNSARRQIKKYAANSSTFKKVDTVVWKVIQCIHVRRSELHCSKNFDAFECLRGWKRRVAEDGC